MVSFLSCFVTFSAVYMDVGCPNFPEKYLAGFVRHGKTWYKLRRGRSTRSCHSRRDLRHTWQRRVLLAPNHDWHGFPLCQTFGAWVTWILFLKLTAGNLFPCPFYFTSELHQQDVWLSLAVASGSGLTVPTCTNEGCDWLLEWGDGHPFLYKDLTNLMAQGGFSLDSANDVGKCFFLSKDTFLIDKGDCTLLKHSSCQSWEVCPGMNYWIT